ncbi:MAG: hypothetical protein JWO19_1417 [Bryobacterales bacterium]|nr:hypothetical protein [Bryobacterales bacterium]
MRSFLLFAGSFVFALAILGQSDRGTITGTISDPAGAVVASAKVEAKNIATSAVYSAASTDTGNYTLSQLPAGDYELNVAVQGFKKYVRQGITVQVAGTLRVDVVLEVGATTESVTVTESTPLLKTESGELSHNVSTDKLDNLPAITLGSGTSVGNIRNPLQAITLLPGTAFATDNTLRVNGMPSSTYSIRIEGQDATNGISRQSTQVNQAGLDAIQEVTVQTSNYAAEFGQAGGGYFNYTMKSGTNQFHGSAYDYFVNEALNAGTPFTAGTGDKSNQHLRSAQRRNDYGFTFGGPIRIPKVYNGHDKSFFFFNFEQFRESQTVTTGLQNVPTLAYRAGDFSAAQGAQLTIGGQPASDALGNPLFQNAVYDPKTQRVALDGSIVRLQYPGNKIPLTDMDPVAARIQAMIPLPTNNGLINNYAVPAYTNFRHTEIPSIKIDHNISSTIKVAGYYSATRTYSPQADGYTQAFTNAYPQDTLSQTTRINYDQTITPTVLLHLGAGLLYTNTNQLTPQFDQSTLGWGGNFTYSQAFPYISFGNDAARGGFSLPGNNATGQAFLFAYYKDIKPTSNASLTWVKGNHTIKTGGEVIFEGTPVQSYSRAHGNFTFAAQQSGNPWEEARGLNSTTGLGYASFLLGRNSALQHSAGANGRLGDHSSGFYIQDTWKVTRKLTLDYGLRYDYVTLYKEEYGRMQNAALHLPNPAAGGRLGTVIYEATCNCSYNHNYPWAIGPRLGAAYQINAKTVLRVGAGLAYGTSPNQQNLGYSIGDFYTVTTPGYGEAADLLRDGNPYAPGNRFGNAPIFWPDFRPNYPIEVSPGLRPPTSPFIYVDRNSGRPPRILQWSIGLQREITRNLVVEAAYVGNRGVWWTAPALSTESYNALTPDILSAYGLNTNVAADRTLLTTRINSPAVISRFPWLANPNNVYPGFPATSSLNQALRPQPQWGTLSPFLGPPLGDTWYDSLQAKVTKRFSHGLSVDSAFTWQKELALGANADTTYLTPAPALISDVFNRNTNKQLSAFSRPLMLVVSFNYTTPRIAADGAGMKVMSWMARDWIVAGLLRYQSGQLIRSPASNNGFFAQTLRNAFGVFGGGNTFWNRVQGQNLFLVDPNCKCFDPTTQLVLNPAAWTDAAPGQFGTSAAYYDNYRWQRQPAESLSLGRNFRLFREGMNFNIRAEFQNVFNRLYLANPALVNVSGFNPTPSSPSAPTVRNATGALSSGYGFVNTFNGNGSQPRSGQIVARITF